MGLLTPEQKQQYAELAAELVYPERYGKVALTPVVEFPHGLILREPREHGWAKLDGYDGAEEPIFGD